ncbi:zinc knuckle CX2CX4HX4C containing protein [Tanacetum coccineum]
MEAPRCDTCKIFDHVHDYCPKKVVSPPIVATSNVVTPNAEKTNDGFQTVGKKKKRKGKSKSTNGGQFTGPSVKHNVRYEPKTTTSAPMKGTTYVGYTSQSTLMLKTTGNSSKKYNLSMSNSFSALNEEEEDDEEEVENVYDESANLIQNTKAGGSSSFTAAAAQILKSSLVNLILEAFVGSPSRFLLDDYDNKPKLDRGTLDRDSFWAEATVTATYLINRSLSTTLEKKTPMDLWSGHPANYEMIMEILGRKLSLRWNFKAVGSKVDDMAAYAFAIAEEEDTHEPITFQEAINSSEKDEWVRAMKEEMSSLKKNHTWELVDQPPGQKLISCKWLYKIKEGIEGVQKPRYKARVGRPEGYTQRAGIDNNSWNNLM